MNKSLFNEFNPISSKEWKQKIQVDLKGADYNDTLIWKSIEGIDVKPLYHSDLDVNTPKQDSKTSQWKIAQLIDIENEETANLKAKDALKRGAECIIFDAKQKTISDVNTLLKDISTDTEIHIYNTALDQEFETLNTSINIHKDAINHLASDGNWNVSLTNDLSAIVQHANNTNTISINMELYQNAGANMSQQLAYGMAHANEYLNYLTNEKTTDLNNITFIFNVSVGSNYFFEIAKLKALRWLWQSISTEYNAAPNCKIIATPTRRNKTIYDYNVNMLRTTTECMSAVLGGADIVYNLPYDAIYHNANEFGDRISRNQLLVLKHESYFDKVNNPTDGVYYINSLTKQLAEKALDIFKQIENGGGFISQLKEGIIQRKIKESENKAQEAFKSSDIVLIGTNKYPNNEDKMKNDLEINPLLESNPRKTLIEPIIPKRLSNQIDSERLSKEA